MHHGMAFQTLESLWAWGQGRPVEARCGLSGQGKEHPALSQQKSTRQRGRLPPPPTDGKLRSRQRRRLVLGPAASKQLPGLEL